MLFSSAAVSGDAVRIVDGDTLDLGRATFRLHGIDAPEYGQRCSKETGAMWDCGKEATQLLQDLVRDQKVTCDDRGSDGYGRTIAVCRTTDFNLNAEMVSRGMAWAFRKYSDDYVEIEGQAKSKGVGVWQAETQTPWEYREAKWNVGVQEASEGCAIKGNISKNRKIYHAPWSPWYSRTKVSPEKGERWFCDESEAVAAGWRAPIWGG
jgi:endonuclease YncB( thermonuclease family)